MRFRIKFLLLILFGFLSIFLKGVLFTPVTLGAIEYSNAEVVDLGITQDQYGLTLQSVTIKILEGKYANSIQNITVDIRDLGLGKLSIQDRIKVSVSENDQGNPYFQFVELERKRSYLPLFFIFFILIISFVGVKGIKSLIPSLSLLFLIMLTFIPSFFQKGSIFPLSFTLLAIIVLLTTWVRLKDKLLTLIMSFSILVCLFIGFAVFLSFSGIIKSSYVLGVFYNLDNPTYNMLIDVVNVSVMYIALGGTLNIGIQIAKFLKEKFVTEPKVSVKLIAKEGFHIGQKVLAGEMNNFMTVFIGLNLWGLFAAYSVQSTASFWNNGWVANQIILLLASGLPLILISPVTILIVAFIINIKLEEMKKQNQIPLRV